MNFEGGYAGLTSGQYRIFLIGFCVPLITALFGMVFPCFAMTTGHVRGSEPFVLIPGFVLAGWMQVETTIAGGRNAARATGAKRRMRGLLLVPMALIPLALLLSIIGLLRAPARDVDLAYTGLIIAMIGAAFLFFTVRARRIPWLQQ